MKALASPRFKKQKIKNIEVGQLVAKPTKELEYLRGT
jgi:hypothetical protein